MRVLSVVSAKGGVGKSTVAANVAVALQRLGHRVLAVDLDPQNGLRFHFSFAAGQGDGMVHTRGDDRLLGTLVEGTASGVGLLPYGDCDESQRQAFEARLRDDPDWLRRALQALGLVDEAIVVVDTPPGPSVYMAQALVAATVAVAVTLPDAGSYLTLPQLHALIESYCTQRPDFQGYGFIVNQMDQARDLSRDVAEMLRSALASRMLGAVHQDQAIREALAYGQDIFQYAPDSEGAHDLMACARSILERLQGADLMAMAERARAW